MRVFGQMVTKNEGDRYLDCCLSWHKGILEQIHVYDDSSVDDTVALARKHGCLVTPRAEHVPTFTTHEGKFRQAAWRAFEAACSPTEEDWILALDADEFLVSNKDETDQLYAICAEFTERGIDAALIAIPEVFAVDEVDGYLVRPQVRVDGEWNRIIGSRLFRYHPFGMFANKAMASGSEPTYITHSTMQRDPNLWLMHYGYADAGDALEKYHRYRELTGHSSAHVNSIVSEEAHLVRWEGPKIDVWRGQR